MQDIIISPSKAKAHYEPLVDDEPLHARKDPKTRKGPCMHVRGLAERRTIRARRTTQHILKENRKNVGDS